MGYLRDLFTHTRPRDLVFFSGYALYLVFSYMSFHSATVLSSGGDLGHGLQVLFLVAVVGGRALTYGLVTGLIKFFQKMPLAVLTALTGVLALMAFLVLGMVFQFLPALDPSLVRPWLVLGGALFGAADALITLLWARFSSTLTLRTVYLYVVLCNAVSLVVYFIATLLPGSFALPVAIALFLVSAVFAKKAIDARPPDHWEFSRPVFQSALRSVAQPILGTVILCFMSGLMLQISGQQDIPLESFQQTSLFTSAILVLCLLLPALLVKKPLNVGRMYAVALPLSAAGFLLLPLIWNAAGGIVNSFAQLGSMVAGIILWCMLAEMSHDTKLPSALLFSIALICTNLAQLAGTLVGYFNADTLKQGDLVLTTVALVAVYLLFMVALFLFKDKSLKGEDGGPEDASVHSEQQLSARCATIAATHQFTPREGDIFLLLAQGYTIPNISEKLFVSENTVKSHVKSVYQKLGIHARSELIELVNQH